MSLVARNSMVMVLAMAGAATDQKQSNVPHWFALVLPTYLDSFVPVVDDKLALEIVTAKAKVVASMEENPRIVPDSWFARDIANSTGKKLGAPQEDVEFGFIALLVAAGKMFGKQATGTLLRPRWTMCTDKDFNDMFYITYGTDLLMKHAMSGDLVEKLMAIRKAVEKNTSKMRGLDLALDIFLREKKTPANSLPLIPDSVFIVPGTPDELNFSLAAFLIYTVYYQVAIDTAYNVPFDILKQVSRMFYETEEDGVLTMIAELSQM